MTDLNEKQQELLRKNNLLEERKRQIEQELKSLERDNYQQPSFQLQNQLEDIKENEQEQEPENDIIKDLEAVKRVQEERRQQKIKELKQSFVNNKAVLEKNARKLEKLENNIGEAEAAVRIQTELKKDLESKGKKVTEESRKWINEVSKLNDKSEELKNSVANLCKEEESFKSQILGLERKLNDIRREKGSYENEQKQINLKVEQSKEEIEKAKAMLKDKELVNKQKTSKMQKSKEKMQISHKRLERQKNELIKAYKKLNQYINLLRKTNIHLQSANSLNFSLKEYLQAIDRTDIIL